MEPLLGEVLGVPVKYSEVLQVQLTIFHGTVSCMQKEKPSEIIYPRHSPPPS
jgi:hypothetical protein